MHVLEEQLQKLLRLVPFTLLSLSQLLYFEGVLPPFLLFSAENL